MIAVELRNINHCNKTYFDFVFVFGIANWRMFLLMASAWPLSPN